ncbi:MAG: hypothetical protein ACRC23_08625, partial [Aeromonas jandaei]
MMAPEQNGNPHHAQIARLMQQGVTLLAKGGHSRVPPLPPLVRWFTIDGFFGTRLTACRPGPTT